MIKENFIPSRTIILAFGIDEESAGTQVIFRLVRCMYCATYIDKQGAPYIAQYLEYLYGKDGIAAILDEGGTLDKSTDIYSHAKSRGMAPAAYEAPYGGNVIFANPATAEKGYFDLRIEVSTPGGHSSIPPPHTVSTGGQYAKTGMTSMTCNIGYRNISIGYRWA